MKYFFLICLVLCYFQKSFQFNKHRIGRKHRDHSNQDQDLAPYEDRVEYDVPYDDLIGYDSPHGSVGYGDGYRHPYQEEEYDYPELYGLEQGGGGGGGGLGPVTGFLGPVTGLVGPVTGLVGPATGLLGPVTGLVGGGGLGGVFGGGRGLGGGIFG